MTADRMLLRHGLRRRRTSLKSKTLLSSSSSRRGAFSAAMQQFEELMTASAAVGPASRPITLYYAMAQAGLAVAAAHKPDPWSFGKHGLKLHNPRSPLADIGVGPEGVGAFQFAAQATSSPELHRPVRFGALWSSLPDLGEVSPLSFAAPEALTVLPEQSSPSAEARVILICPNPGPEKFMSTLTEALPKYPGISGFRVIPGSYREIRKNRWSVDLQWDRPLNFDEVAPPYRYNGEHYLRPSLDDQGGKPPSPFMTWWAILYTFSMLSRYFPREWATALDIDKSPDAYLLEYALDLALDVVPHLTMEALDGEPALFTKPLAF
ncbi:YaaC family protein [Micromonospora sp. PTRAS2]